MTVLDTRLSHAGFQDRVARFASRYLDADDATRQTLLKQLSELRAQMQVLRNQFLSESSRRVNASVQGAEQRYADLIRKSEDVIRSAVSVVEAQGLACADVQLP